MKTSQKIASEIKNYLVKLAIDGKLDGDISQLDETAFVSIIEKFENDDESIQAKRIEKAGMILFVDEGDLSIADQIKLIEAHADLSHDNESDMIDHVDGVTTCEASEYSYTCESFLEAIN